MDYMYIHVNERCRRKEERSKHGQMNNKAKQHSTPKAVTFPKANELPRVGLEPTTLYTLNRVLYQLSYMYVCVCVCACVLCVCVNFKYRNFKSFHLDFLNHPLPAEATIVTGFLTYTCIHTCMYMYMYMYTHTQQYFPSGKLGGGGGILNQ